MEVKKCNNCFYYYQDHSTGFSECTNEDISEKLLEKHYTNDQHDCKYWTKNNN